MGRRYHYATTLDRTPAFVEELLALGEHRAGEFLDGLEGRVLATGRGADGGRRSGVAVARVLSDVTDPRGDGGPGRDRPRRRRAARGLAPRQSGESDPDRPTAGGATTPGR